MICYEIYLDHSNPHPQIIFLKIKIRYGDLPLIDQKYFGRFLPKSYLNFILNKSF